MANLTGSPLDAYVQEQIDIRQKVLGNNPEIQSLDVTPPIKTNPLANSSPVGMYPRYERISLLFTSTEDANLTQAFLL